MKKILSLLISILLLGNIYAGNQWQEGTGQDSILGSINPSDIDKDSFENVVDPLDRLLSNHREGVKISYASASTITVSAGEITLSNAAGTIRLMQQNTSATTVSWSDIDTGNEAASTTYYLWAYQETVTDTDFDVCISLSSTTPSGKTYYKRLGSFYNDSSSNIVATSITNDNDNNFDESISNYLYDSGWFAVATATTYTKTHSLATRKALIVVYLAENSDGSGWCVLAGPPFVDGNYQTELVTLSTTQLKIRTGANYLASFYDADGTDQNPTSGYCRVLMLALE